MLRSRPDAFRPAAYTVRHRRSIIAVTVFLGVAAVVWAAAPVLDGPLPGPLPLFPATNWWNLDITNAPVDPNSATYIAFIGGAPMHPDFGPEVNPSPAPGGDTEVYGFPYIVVDGAQAKKTVQFDFSDESDGVDHATDTSFPFYPIPDEAITQSHWIEEGYPGSVNHRDSNDRHMLIVDKDNKLLYELYNVFWDGTTWIAGSGALFDMKTDNRRPEGWTSADAGGLAILPGLVRHDEVFGTAEIGHAFRVTVHDTANSHVFPASHTACNACPSNAPPMGARLRLKASTVITTQPPEMQRIFRAMKKYGLIVADNGSDMYISGTYDHQWDNDILNPAFGSLHASDFEVIQLGFNPTEPVPQISIGDAIVTEGNSGTTPATVTATLGSASSRTVSVSYATMDGTAMAGSDYMPRSGTLTFPPGATTASFTVPVVGDTVDEANEAFLVVLSSPVNATLSRATGQVTILDDDGRVALCVPILTVPITITAQGNYCLVRNLSTAQATGAAVTVASDFVSVNMHGFKIGGGAAGLGTQAVGVYALNRKNVAIRNGNLRGFLQGIFLQDTSGTFTASQGDLVEDMRMDENTLAGIHVQGRGSVVRRNLVSTTGGTTALGANVTTYGILSEGAGARVLLNDVTDTVGVGTGDGVAVAITSGNGTVAERNRIGNAGVASSSGIRITGSASVLAIANRLASLGAGIEYLSSTGRFRDNLTSGVGAPYTGGTDAGNNN